MAKRARIYLADLRASLLCGREMPLGVANIAAMLKVHVPDVDVLLFTDPLELKEAIDSRPPDFMMSSNFSWNHNLSLHMSQYARRANPRCVCIMGGPNIHSDAPRRTAFLQENSFLDFHVLTFSGEYPALRLVRSLLESDLDVAAVKDQPERLENVMYLRDGQYQVVGNGTKLKTLDEIPSVYEMGLMDKFFEAKLVPRIQGTRGCPYSCTFCRLGVDDYGKMTQLSVERFGRDLQLIIEMMQKYEYENTILRIADDNFGLPPNDYDKAMLLRETFDRTGMPNKITTDTAKFVDDKAFRTLGVISDLLYINNTSQSLNPETLEAIRRPNKGLEFFTNTSYRLRQAGFNTRTEVIAGLPLETRESFIEGLSKLDEMGFSDIAIYQLTLTNGASMDDLDYVEKFNLRTKRRRFYGTSIEIDGVTIEEYDRVVVESTSMSEDDYYFMRLIGFLTRLETSFRNAPFFDYLRRHLSITGPMVADLVGRRIDQHHKSDNRALELLREFVLDARYELLENVVEGQEKRTLPQNLVHFYTMRVLTEAYSDLCDLYCDILLEQPQLAGAEEIEVLEAFRQYMKLTDIRAQTDRISNGGSMPEGEVVTFDIDQLAEVDGTGHERDSVLQRVTYHFPPEHKQGLRGFFNSIGKSDEDRVWGHSSTQTRFYKYLKTASLPNASGS